MPQPAVSIDGLAKVVRELERLGVETDDLRAAFAGIAKDVEGESQRRVRVATGALRGTIRAGTRTKNKAVVRAGTARVAYAGVVNYARPGDHFLTGPANDDPERHKRRIEAELTALVRKLD